MTLPLLMTGPGGDYRTRYDVKGTRLVKQQATQSQGHDPNAESSGGGAYLPLPGRGNAEENLRGDSAGAQAPIRLVGGSAPRVADRFDHTLPTTHATYAKPGRASLEQKLATLDAIRHWVNAQDQLLDELAEEHQLMAQGVARGLECVGQPAAKVRIIRWNGGTLAMKAKAKAKAKHPEPAIQAAAQTARSTEPDPLTRNLNHDTPLTTTHPQPDTQTNEDPHDDPRHAAVAGLFPDDEGARAGLRRLQGHRFRARRSAHQKGLPHPRPQQGALFGAVA